MITIISTIITYFKTQSIPYLCSRSPFKLASVPFWACPYFLAQQSALDSSCTFPALALDSAITPWSPGSCSWRMVFRSQDLGTRYTHGYQGLQCSQFLLMNTVREYMYFWYIYFSIYFYIEKLEFTPLVASLQDGPPWPCLLGFMPLSERHRDYKKWKEVIGHPKFYWQKTGWDNHTAANTYYLSWKKKDDPEGRAKSNGESLQGRDRTKSQSMSVQHFLGCISNCLDHWLLCTSHFPPYELLYSGYPLLISPLYIGVCALGVGVLITGFFSSGDKGTVFEEPCLHLDDKSMDFELVL